LFSLNLYGLFDEIEINHCLIPRIFVNSLQSINVNPNLAILRSVGSCAWDNLQMNNFKKDGINVMTISANRVRQIREAKMMSKAELARKAEVTVQTIHRIENGNECRLDTKRKIILALGFELSNRTRIFDDEKAEKATTS